MKSLVTAMGAATLLGSCVQVAAGQSSSTRPAPSKVGETALLHVPVVSQVPSLSDHEMDACHKRDTRPREGPNYPCVMQAWIEYSCQANGTTQQHLQAQQQCICGKGSSFFTDAVACSLCKTRYGLQGTAEHPYWENFYQQKLEPSYCQASVLEGDFFHYFQKANPGEGYPPQLGSPENPVNNEYGPIGVVAVKEYYPNAPERQGPGEFTPVPPSNNAPAAKDTNATVPVDGAIAVPAVVVIKPNATSTPPTTAAPSSTAAPTTLVRVTAKNTTAQALPPTGTSNATLPQPSAIDDQQSLVVNGHAEAFTLYTEQKCAVIFTGGSVDNFDFVCTTIEIFRASIRRLVTKEQWDVAKKLPDASIVKDCEAALKENGITGDILSKDVEAPGNEKKLPDSDKVPVSDKVPTSGGQNGQTGLKTESDDECIDEDAATPGNKTSSGDSNNNTSGGNSNKTPSGESNKTPSGDSNNKTPSGESNKTPSSDSNNNTSGGNSNKTPSSDSNKVPTSGGQNGQTGSETESDDECIDEDATPGNKTPSGDSNKTPGGDSNNKTSGGESNKTPGGDSNNKTSGSDSNNTSGGESNKTPGSDSNNKTPGGESETPGGNSNNKTPSGESNKTPSSDSNNQTPGGQPGNSSNSSPAGQNQPDACAEQARMQQACENKRDCICKEPFFLAATKCVRQKESTCDTREYWTQFFLELQYRFCEKNELGQTFNQAYVSQIALWHDTRNPLRRKQFN